MVMKTYICAQVNNFVYVLMCFFIETGSRNLKISLSIFQECLLILSTYDSFDWLGCFLSLHLFLLKWYVNLTSAPTELSVNNISVILK